MDALEAMDYNDELRDEFDDEGYLAHVEYLKSLEEDYLNDLISNDDDLPW